MAGSELLRRRELERYRELIPDKEDCQDKWDAALDDLVKYVTLLVWQCNNEKQLAGLMKRIWHKSSALKQSSQNFFLGYHELNAHIQWLVSRPADAESYKRFQVGKCACCVYVSLTCHSHVSLIGAGFIWMLVLTLGGLLLKVMNQAKDWGHSKPSVG